MLSNLTEALESGPLPSAEPQPEADPRAARVAAILAAGRQGQQAQQPAGRAERVQQLAEKFGLPQPTVGRNLEQVEQRDAEQQVGQLLRMNPALAEWIDGQIEQRAPEVFRNRDEVGALASYASALRSAVDMRRMGFESAGPLLAGVDASQSYFREVGRFPGVTMSGAGAGLEAAGTLLGDEGRPLSQAIATAWIGALRPSAAETFKGLARGVGQAITATPEQQARYAEATGREYTPPARALRELGQALRGAGDPIKAAVDESLGLPEGRENIVTETFGALGQLSAQIATFMLTGGAATGAVLFAQGADIATERVESANPEAVGTDDAALATIASGAVTALTERVGLQALLNRMPTQAKNQVIGLLLDVGKAGGIEALQELTEGIAHDVLYKALIDPNAGIGEDVLQEMLVGFNAGAIMRLLLRAQGSRYRDRSIAAQAEALDKLVESGAKSKMDPSMRADLVQALSKSMAGADTVFIPADKWRELYQDGADARAAELLGENSNWDEASLTGGDVAVPMSVYLTQIAPEHHGALRAHLRLRPDDPSMDDIERGNAADTDAAALRAMMSAMQDRPDTGIYDDMRGQLRGAGFEPDVADRYAKLIDRMYSVLAERAGMDPMELYRRNVPIVRRPAPDALAARPSMDATLQSMIDALRSGNIPTDADVHGASLLSWLVSKGGLRDDGGELAARDAGRARPGLISSRGMSLDDAVVAAYEAGFLTERPTQFADQYDDGGATIQTLLDLIDRELGGDPVYSTAGTNVQREQFRTAVEQLGEYLAEIGVDVATASDAEIMAAVKRGLEPAGEGRELFQSVSIRSSKEALKKYGLDPNGRYKTREVAAALEARQRAKYGMIDADDRSPEALAKIAKWITAEVEFEMQNPEQSGVGWYSEKFQRALDIMGDVFPELKTDQTARDIMTALIAITSDGQKVVPNFAQAMDIYGNFRPGGATEGRFTTTRGHARQASIDTNLAVIQRLYDAMGPEAMHTYLMQEKTISELKKIAQANGGEMKSAYQAHIKMPMAAVEFGPKLGAFYANLMGAHGYLTMDRWWSRTFNRYRGTLLQAPTRAGLDRFKGLLGRPELSDDEAISATVEHRNSYEARGFKNGTEIEKAANTIWKAAFDALEDSPFSAKDRTFMLDAVNKAQKSLKRKGHNLSVADIQAILWYYEKRLYGELGARQTADISYEEAAQRVASSYASGSGIESLLNDEGAAPEDGGADAGRVPVGGEQFSVGQADQAGLDAAPDGDRLSALRAALEPRELDQSLPDTIEVDGQQRPTTNSDGQPIHPTREGVEAFWRWFGDSKVVDEQGRPVVVYHGTDADFEAFDPGKIGSATDDGHLGRGFYFSTDPRVIGSSSVGMPVYLRAESPVMASLPDFRTDKRTLAPRDLGSHDSVILDYSPTGYSHKEVMVRSPTQIKSAIGNRGTFDAGDGRILFQSEGARELDQSLPDTIEVDGQQRPTTNSDGQPIHPTREGVEAFWRWFGDSKVVDEQGRPVVRYHGTNAAHLDPSTGINEFIAGSGERGISRAEKSGENLHGQGIWFGSRVEAEDYSGFDYSAGWAPDGASVYPVYLSIKSPQDIGWRDARHESVPDLKSSGKDGAYIIENGNWVVFDSTQIKSAIGNRGTFDAGDGRILFQLGDASPGADGARLSAFEGMTREQFMGSPRITPASNAAGLKPKALDTVVAAVPEPFAGGFTARYSEDGAAVFDGDTVVASYNFGDTLVVAKGYRRQGIAEELVYQWRTRNPDAKPASHRTKAAQAVQSKVWDRIQSELSAGRPARELFQPRSQAGKRGSIVLGRGRDGREFTISLFEKADLSTFLHESGHMFLEILGDLAADPQAPQQIRDDYATALKWMGAEAGQPIATEYHEKFARGFEAYLYEGKAPTVELAGLFARFKGWLMTVYRKLSQLDVELTDEVRQVFDRMIATDAEIEAANAQQGLQALFKEAGQAGFTEKQWATYQRLTEQAALATQERAHARVLSVLKRETRAWWKDERAKVEAEVQAEVDAQPVYIARAWLKRGTMPDGAPLPEGVAAWKLAKGPLLDRYGQEFLKRLRGLYSLQGGEDIDVAARFFGFESGSQMVDLLAAAPDRRRLIQQETTRRMRERFGDPMADGTLAEVAMKATHNNKRLAVMLAEARALAELAGEPAPDGAALRAAAAATVGEKTVGKLRPAQYLRAERKAAKEAQQHFAKGDNAKALAAKRVQLVNAHLYDAASRAEDQLERARSYIMRFARGRTREKLGKVSADLLRQADAILDAIDLRRLTGRSLADARSRVELLRRANDGEITMAPKLLAMLERSARKPWVDLTVDEAMSARDALAQIWAGARLTYEGMINGQKEQLDDLAEQISESVVLNGSPRAITLAMPTPGQSVAASAKQALLSWLRPGAIARLLDGGKERGPVTRWIIEPIRRAYAEQVMPRLEQARETVAGLYSSNYSRREMRDMHRRRFVKSLGGEYSKAEVLAMALNWGNEGNRQALLDSSIAGVPVFTSEQQVVGAFAEVLDARDWRFVQGVWDYINTFWPAISETERRRRGIVPKKVEASPFRVRTSDGQMVDVAGGYYRLRYSRELSADQRGDDIEQVMKDMMMGRHVAASTRAGSTHERVGSAGRPVLLSLNVLDQHLDEVIRDLYLGDEIRAVMQLLNHKQVRAAMTATDNLEALDTLKMWLQDSATGELGAHSTWEKVSAWARAGFTAAKLGLSMTTVLLQFTGIPQTMAVVGTRHYAPAAARFATAPVKWSKAVMELSPFMRTRYSQASWNRDVQDVRAFIGGESSPVPRALRPAMQKISGALFAPIMAAQFPVDTTTWMAAYAKGQALGVDDAVRYADSVVENAQTSGLFSDRSGIERGTLSARTRQSAFVKLWTTLISYMLAKGNIAFESAARVKREKSLASAVGFATDMVLLFVVEALLVMAVRGQLFVDDDEPEDFIGRLAFNVADGVTGGIPLVREVTGARFGGGTTPVGALATDTFKLLGAIGRDASEDEIRLSTLKMASNIAGQMFGLPSTQFNRALDAYWREHVDGEDVAPVEYVLGRRQ